MQHEIFSNMCSFVYNVNSTLRSSSHPPQKNLISEEALSLLESKKQNSNEHTITGSRTSTTPIIIIQHKPAYLEQLILCISNTPHILQNSFYMVNECTGPYPCLVDLTSTSNGGLVGRNHPSSPSKLSDHYYHDCQSDIITYLRLVHDIDLDKSIPTTTDNDIIDPTVSSQRSFIQTLIIHKLQPILFYFQCCASQNQQRRNKIHDWMENIFLNPFHTFQSFALYHSNCRSIPSFIQDEEMATQMAKEAYHCLDIALQQSNDSSNTNAIDSSTSKQKMTLLHTKEYTNIDCLLYAHLCEALLEPSLFFVLRKCTNILLFYKTIRTIYFENESIISSTSSNNNNNDQKDEWKIQNNIINEENQYYNHLPLSLLFNDLEINNTDEEEQKERDLDILQAALKGKRKRKFTNGATLQNLLFYGSFNTPPPAEEGECMFWNSNMKSNKNNKSESSTRTEESSSGNVHNNEVMKRKLKDRQHQDIFWLGGMFGMISFVYCWGS